MRKRMFMAGQLSSSIDCEETIFRRKIDFMIFLRKINSCAKSKRST